MISYSELVALKDLFISSLWSRRGSQVGKISNNWPFWIFTQCAYFVAAGSAQCLSSTPVWNSCAESVGDLGAVGLRRKYF